MTYMLDTNICIYAIKKKPEKVLQRLLDHIDEGICISSITLPTFLTMCITKHREYLINRFPLQVPSCGWVLADPQAARQGDLSRCESPRFL